MDKQDIVNRIDQLLVEKHLTMNSLMNDADISTTVYQWKSNRNRDATRINMRVLKSIDDSDSFQKYMCTNECLNLMMVKGVAKKVKELLWDDHPAIKAALTRWLNKNNISLVA